MACSSPHHVQHYKNIERKIKLHIKTFRTTSYSSGHFYLIPTPHTYFMIVKKHFVHFRAWHSSENKTQKLGRMDTNILVQHIWVHFIPCCVRHF